MPSIAEAKTAILREFREFRRYTGDGLPGEPTGAPLPVGDPQSGAHNPKKSGFRGAFGGLFDALEGILGDIAEGVVPDGGVTDDKVAEDAGIASSKLSHLRFNDPDIYLRRLVSEILHEDALKLTEVVGAGGTIGVDATAKFQRAIDALPAIGGEIIIPAGDWRINGTVTVLGKPVTFRWMAGATVWSGSATEDVFQARGRAADFTRFINPRIRQVPGLAKTNGAFISLGGVTDDDYIFGVEVSGGLFEGAFIGINAARVWLLTIRKNHFLNMQNRTVAPGGGGINIYSGYSHHVTIADNFMQVQGALPDNPTNINDVATMPTFGIRLAHVDVAFLTDNSIIRCGTAVWMNPGNGQFVAIVQMKGTNYDTSAQSLYMEPTGTGFVTRIDFAGTWASGQTDVAIKAVASGSAYVREVKIHDTTIVASAIGIFLLGPNVDGVIIHDMNITGLTGEGVLLNNAKQIYMHDNLIGAFSGGAGNTVGLSIAAGTTGRSKDDIITGNTTNVANGSGGGFTVS